MQSCGYFGCIVWTKYNTKWYLILCPQCTCDFGVPGAMHTVYPKKYAHGCVVLCFVVVMQSFIMNSREVFIHIHQGCFAGTGAIVRLPQCQWSKPDGYGKISQCITTTKHSKAKTVCIVLGIYCTLHGKLTWWTDCTDNIFWKKTASYQCDIICKITEWNDLMYWHCMYKITRKGMKKIFICCCMVLQCEYLYNHIRW